MIYAIIALAVWLLTLTCYCKQTADDADYNKREINNLHSHLNHLQTKLNKLEDYLGIYWKNYSPDFPKYEKKSEVGE